MSEYPNISRWLGGWMEQLVSVGGEDDYRVVCDEVREGETFIEHREHLQLLDSHLELANDVCANFEECMAEKKTLPPMLHDANAVVLNKLAEVRAIVGLSRLGFADIRFVSTPDLVGIQNGNSVFVEVSRLNKGFGQTSDVWDLSLGDLEHDGYMIGDMKPPSSPGEAPKALEAISLAVYRKVEAKYDQSTSIASEEGSSLVWISLGRDYLTAGAYELPGVDEAYRTGNDLAGLEDCIGWLETEEKYKGLLIVLSPGRDYEDHIYEVH